MRSIIALRQNYLFFPLQPVLEIRAGNHPGLASGGKKLFNRDYIANDTYLGGDHGDVLLLTGTTISISSSCSNALVFQVRTWAARVH